MSRPRASDDEARNRPECRRQDRMMPMATGHEEGSPTAHMHRVSMDPLLRSGPGSPSQRVRHAGPAGWARCLSVITTWTRCFTPQLARVAPRFAYS